jgi:hypothetical protein
MSLFSSSRGGGSRHVSTVSLTNLKRSVFGVNYYLQKDLHSSRAFYVSAFIQFIFLLSAAFLEEDKFEWNHTTDWFKGTLQVLTLNGVTFGRAGFTIAFVASAVVVTLTLMLASFVASSLNSGTVPSFQVSKALRTLLSLSVAFQGPIAGSLLNVIDCDYGGDMHNARGDFKCLADPGWTAAFVAAAILLPLFVGLLVSASFMFEFSPRSYNSTARTVGWIDMCYSVFQVSVVAFFRLVDAPIGQGLFLGVGSLLLLAAVVEFQPFYHSTMNDVRACYHGVHALTGLSLALLALVDRPDSSVVSVVYLTLLLPVGYHAYALSARRLRGLVAEGRAALVDEDDCASPEEIMDIVDNVQAESARSLTWAEWREASRVEIRTRFLVADLSKAPTAEELRQADLLIRRGVRQYQLSQGLVVSYISFLFHWAEDVTIANLMVSRCHDVAAWSVENQYAVYRFAKNIARVRQGGHSGRGKRGNRAMDVMSWEEAQKALRSARAQHKKARYNIIALLRALATGTATEESVTQRIEGAYKAEVTCSRKFQFLIANTPPTQSLYTALSLFLRDVMFNPAAAEAVNELAAEERAQADRAGGESSNGASSTGGTSAVSAENILKANGQGALTSGVMTESSRKTKSLICRMRVASALIISIVVALFLTYYLKAQTFNTVLLNLNDSGLRRMLVVSGARFSREMHLAAAANDYAKFQSMRGKLAGNMAKLQSVHEGLMQDYKSDYPGVVAFNTNPNIDMHLVDADGVVQTVRRNGNDAVMSISLAGQALANEQAANTTFAALAAWDPAAPQTVPDAYFLMQNGVTTEAFYRIMCLAIKRADCKLAEVALARREVETGFPVWQRDVGKTVMQKLLFKAYSSASTFNVPETAEMTAIIAKDANVTKEDILLVVAAAQPMYQNELPARTI